MSREPVLFVVESVVVHHTTHWNTGVHEQRDRHFFIFQGLGGSCGFSVGIRFRRSRLEMLVGHGIFFQQLRLRGAARCAQTKAYFE